MFVCKLQIYTQTSIKSNNMELNIFLQYFVSSLILILYTSIYLLYLTQYYHYVCSLRGHKLIIKRLQ